MFFLILSSCCLALLILKCTVALTIWFLRRFKKIQISCQSHYIIWYKNIVFAPNSNLQFSINNIWLSSSYVNRSFKKPLVIGLRGFKVKVREKMEDSPKRSLDDDLKGARSKHLQLLHIFEKFVSLSIFDMEVEREDSKARSSFANKQMMLEVERGLFENDLAVRLLFHGFSVSHIPHETKAFLDVSTDAILDISVTCQISGSASNPVVIKSLRMDCSKIGVTINGDAIRLPSSSSSSTKQKEISANIRGGDDDDRDDPHYHSTDEYNDNNDHNDDSDVIGNVADVITTKHSINNKNNKKLETILKLFPMAFQVNISEVKVDVICGNLNRTFSASVKEVSLATEGPSDGGDLTIQDVKLDLSNLAFCSNRREMILLEQTGFHLLLTREEASMNLSCMGVHVTYLHDEVVVLSLLVGRLLLGSSTRPPKESSTFASLLLHRSATLQMKFYMNLYQLAFLVTDGDEGSDFLLGIPGARVSVMGAVQDGSVSDCIIEVEMTSTYIKLQQHGSNSASNNSNNNNNTRMEELSAKRHFWGTPMYLGLLFLKLTKYGNHISAECMVDNLRFESSETILNAVQSLDDIVGADLTELCHWLKSRKAKKPAPKVDQSAKQGKSSVQLFLQMSCLNVFVCHRNNVSVMLRCDSASIPLCSPSDVSLILFGIKVSHFFRGGKFHVITKSSDIANEILSIPMASVNFNLPLRNVVVEAAENVVMVWSYSVHLCLHEAIKRLVQIFRRGSSASQPTRRDGDGEKKRTAERVEVMLFFSCSIHVNMSANHYMKCSLKNFQVEQTSTDGIIIKTSRLLMSSDQHPFLSIENLKLKSDPRGDKLTPERSLISDLLMASNRSWIFTADEIAFTFAFDYNFSAWFEEVKSLRKWLRMRHSKSSADPCVAADVFLSINCITIQICDDPFEVKLGDNYELLCDESLENEKRINALNKRVEELKMKNTFIPEEKLESLYVSLSEKMSQVYIQRANHMYSQSPMRTSLCMWVIQSFEMVLLADPSMTYKQDILNFMHQVNGESPIPEDLEFQSFFLRRLRCSTSSIMFQLRDFPHPILHIEDWFLSGRFAGAEADGIKRGKRLHLIDLGHPWGTTTISKNLPPVKLYYDINSELKSFSMTHGSCWEPIAAQVSLSMNKIFRPSTDPSPALPFWDKWRYLLHGNFTVAMDKGSWMCHASLDPYNTTEFMDWAWSDLVFKWVTGEVSFGGDLEILLRTASKYDECCFLKWNSLQLLYKLDWQCVGDPNDHHSVVPCSTEYVATLSNAKDHDSYANFRSASLIFGFSMKSSSSHSSSSHSPSSPLNFSPVSPGDAFSPGPSTSPKCLFYSSTIRWLDHLKICIGKVSRPIRRGRYFKNPITGKPKFTKHISCLNLSLVLPSLNCSYWSSFRRSFGVELNCGPIELDVSVAIETRRPLEGSQGAWLTRRQQRVVGMMKFQASFESLAIWLSSQIHQRKTKFKPLESERSFLLSVDKVIYERNEEQQTSDEPLHKVEVHDLKACWTPYNRDIVFALHDSYTKSQMLQRNLSADALKGVKVEPANQTPKKASKPLGNQFNYSASSNQPLHADALLQKLISESESKFVAVHEEIAGSSVDVEHLQGYQVCQTDDVTRKNWIVTLVNSQVMLSGCETSGCIIVSTPRASLLSRLHHPVITNDHLVRSKTTLVGSIESMQYYATITDDIRPENIRWLTTRDIRDRRSLNIHDPSTSLTLENIIRDTDDVQTDISHIQRIISRCQCAFYWSWYGELEDDMLEVPLQIDEYSDVMKTQEGIDAFTLIHHDLNICTNSVQYATALDIVNNLLLHVEPKKKEQLERLMNMRFKLQLSSDSDHKTPIFVRQTQLRKLMEKMRYLEREVYMSQRNSLEEETQELLRDLEDTKEQINFLNEELALMLSCYRESLLQTSSSSSSSPLHRHKNVKREAMMTKKIDLYLQHVEWRLNEADGQIGISHIMLSNFLYTKTMHENDCGSHQLELGWCHVTNLLPEDQTYKDVLIPQDSLGRTNLGNRRSILRVLCKFRSPVGGISIKEHLEVNVVPLTIQMTARFYSVVMMFFFPGKPVESDDESVSDLEESQSTSSLTLMSSKRKFASLRKKSSTMCSVNDIDKMKERAAKNNMFIYIKISDVSLKVSYKSEKDKHIMNIRDFQFLSPMLEYHNQTWSWHDLTMTLKRECKKVIIAQAVRQKLHIKSKSLFSDMIPFPRGVTGSEEDTDKTKLLLGLSIPEMKQKKSKRKSFFGK